MDQSDLIMVLQKIEVIFETILEMQNRINNLESIVKNQEKIKNKNNTLQSKNSLRVV